MLFGCTSKIITIREEIKSALDICNSKRMQHKKVVEVPKKKLQQKQKVKARDETVQPQIQNKLDDQLAIPIRLCNPMPILEDHTPYDDASVNYVNT